MCVCILAFTCEGDPEARVDCGYPGIPESACRARNCCWDDSIWGVKWCFHGSKYHFHYLYHCSQHGGTLANKLKTCVYLLTYLLTYLLLMNQRSKLASWQWTGH